MRENEAAAIARVASGRGSAARSLGSVAIIAQDFEKQPWYFAACGWISAL